MFEWPSDPDLLFDAAREVKCFQLEHEGQTRYFLLFVRRAAVIDEELNSMPGVMIAFFECDTAGKVYDWNQRFEMEGRTISSTFFRFAYRFVNDLISPLDVRRAIIDERQLDRLNAMLPPDEALEPPTLYFDEPGSGF